MRDGASKGARRIIQVLNEIKEAIEKHTKAYHSQNEREKEKRDVPTEVRAEVRFDDETIGNEATEKGADRRIQNSIRRAAWCAFFAASIYAAIAATQTYWTRQATVATQKNLSDFEAVEAAQIAVEFMPTVKMGKPGQGLIVDGNIDVTNIGLTTAVDFTAMGYFWDRNLKPPQPGVPYFQSGSGNVTPFNVSGVRLGSGRTNHYPVGIQVGQADEIRRGGWQAGIWIDYKFDDVFGHPYSGRDCFMVNPSNVLEFIRCPKPTTTVTIPMP